MQNSGWDRLQKRLRAWQRLRQCSQEQEGDTTETPYVDFSPERECLGERTGVSFYAFGDGPGPFRASLWKKLGTRWVKECLREDRLTQAQKAQLTQVESMLAGKALCNPGLLNCPGLVRLTGALSSEERTVTVAADVYLPGNGQDDSASGVLPNPLPMVKRRVQGSEQPHPECLTRLACLFTSLLHLHEGPTKEASTPSPQRWKRLLLQQQSLRVPRIPPVQPADYFARVAGETGTHPPEVNGILSEYQQQFGALHKAFERMTDQLRPTGAADRPVECLVAVASPHGFRDTDDGDWRVFGEKESGDDAPAFAFSLTNTQLREVLSPKVLETLVKEKLRYETRDAASPEAAAMEPLPAMIGHLGKRFLGPASLCAASRFAEWYDLSLGLDPRKVFQIHSADARSIDLDTEVFGLPDKATDWHPRLVCFPLLRLNRGDPDCHDHESADVPKYADRAVPIGVLVGVFSGEDRPDIVWDATLRLWRFSYEAGDLLPTALEAQEAASQSARRETMLVAERIRAGLAIGLYHQLGQDLTIVQQDANSTVVIANRMQQAAADAAGKTEVLEFDLQRWPGRARDLKDDVQRAAQHRQFAFEALTGRQGNGPIQTADLACIVLDMLRTAYGYAFGENVSEGREIIRFDQAACGLEGGFEAKGIHLTVPWDDLRKHHVERSFYEFVLQELCVNAVKTVKDQTSGSIQLSVDDKAITIQNTMTARQYKELKGRLPPSEPPAMRQSGWGIHGVWAYFKHVHDVDFEGIQPLQDVPDDRPGAVTRVPLLTASKGDDGEHE